MAFRHGLHHSSQQLIRSVWEECSKNRFWWLNMVQGDGGRKRVAGTGQEKQWDGAWVWGTDLGYFERSSTKYFFQGHKVYGRHLTTIPTPAILLHHAIFNPAMGKYLSCAVAKKSERRNCPWKKTEGAAKYSLCQVSSQHIHHQASPVLSHSSLTPIVPSLFIFAHYFTIV